MKGDGGKMLFFSFVFQGYMAKKVKESIKESIEAQERLAEI